MTKKILSFALVATIFGSFAAGCSSEKKAGTIDSTAVDTSKKTVPDTITKDTGKMSTQDTAKKIPM